MMVDPRIPAVFVHGSFAADANFTWEQQRTLSSERELRIARRRGYPGGKPRTSQGFGDDIGDVIELLGTGAHLVGFSYGGVVSLLVSAQRPDLVRSLTVIEPPAYGLVRDDADAITTIERVAALYPTSQFSPEQYRIAFLRAIGGNPREPIEFTSQERQATIASMEEAPPWEAPISLETLRNAAFPKLVVSGNWNRGIESIADVLERGLLADRVVLEGAGHAVQQLGDPFNRVLAEFWGNATFHP